MNDIIAFREPATPQPNKAFFEPAHFTPSAPFFSYEPSYEPNNNNEPPEDRKVKLGKSTSWPSLFSNRAQRS